MSIDVMYSRHRPNPAEIRMQKGISLHQIADSTKISVRFLEAIENGRFDLLPGGIYDINYIRQYARAIGVDEGKLLAYYRAVTPVSV